MYQTEIQGKNGYYAKMVADSASNITGTRIATLEICYPRFIHAEFMTHRVFSRNASSSRAIPIEKIMEQVRTNPAMPIFWGTNKPGMQAGAEVENTSQVEQLWLLAGKDAVTNAKLLNDFGLHKQIVNRVMEPWHYIKVVVTSTEWSNFFALRDHHAAQPEIQHLAQIMNECMDQSNPIRLGEDEWHLPYISLEEMANASGEDFDNLIKASVARCARVSYMNHDNTAPDLEKDLELYDMLATRPYDNGKGFVLAADEPTHMSPLEHQATPFDTTDDRFITPAWNKIPGVTHLDKHGHVWSGNFRDWIQFRQTI